MRSTTARADPFLPVAAALASGALAFVADYPSPVPALLLIAPLPALAVAWQGSAPRAAGMGAVAALVGGADMWRALADDVMGTPLPLVAAMVLAMAAMHAAVFAATVALGRRLPAVLAVLVYPTLAVLAEYGLSAGPGLWFTPSTTLAGAHWMLPLAAWGGPHVLTFVALLVPSTLAVALAERPGPLVALPAAAAAGLAAVALLAAPAMPAERVRVAAVSSRVPAEVDARRLSGDVRSEDTWAILGGLERLVRRAAADGARVVVWPEYGVFVRAEDREPFRRRVVALARETGAIVVGGWIDVAAREDRAILVSPDGGVDEYTKQHLILAVESSWLTPGRRAFASVARDGLRVGTNICYDLDYPPGPRAAVRDGVVLLAAPARDWASIEERHAGQSVVRAAENRVAMVRATAHGRSLLVEPSGRIVAAASDGAVPELVLAADLPLARGGAPYTRTGDLLVVACALFLAGAFRVARHRPARP